MLRLILNEMGYTVKDHRNSPVTQGQMALGKDTSILVDKYRKSTMVRLNGLTFWNVSACVWAGSEDNLPMVQMGPKDEVEPADPPQAGYKLF